MTSIQENQKPPQKSLRSKVLYSNELLTSSKYSFLHFFYGIYAPAVMQVEQVFEPGQHLDEWCYRLQAFNRTVTVAPRLHLKTTTDLGYICWQLFKLRYEKFRNYDEVAFMSYLEDGAQYQLRRLKRYISYIPFFDDYKNMTIATGLINYVVDGREFFCEPMGILSFKRGKHPRILICDDILRDPKSKRMSFEQLDEVKLIFGEQVESMPREQLHVLGTPQANGDLFTKLEADARYNCKRYDAIVDEKRRVALWPECFPFDELEKIRNGIGEKAFNKEYRCRPVSGEEGFFRAKMLDAICKRRLKNYDLLHTPKFRELTYGGLDIGKKTHPSHLFVLAVDRKGRLIQIHDKWMDGWDYKDQIEYCRQAIKIFNIEKLLYDDTRSEFEGFKESETLPDEMEGLVLTGKSIWELASSVDQYVTSDKLWLLNIPRSKSQLMNVDNDLKAPDTEEGHSDNFTSLCLAIRAFEIGSSPLVREL